MKTKKCSKCQISKTEEEFRFRNKTLGVRQGVCKECLKKRDAEWYAKNDKRKEQVKDKRKKYRDELNDVLSKLKENGKCSKCGEERWYVLDYHHLEKEEKEYNISQFKRLGFSKERVLIEIEKCILLCSNCHREFHYLERVDGIDIKEYLKTLL